MFKPTGVVKVQVAHYNGFHILDIVAGLFDGIWELVLCLVDYAREHVSQGWTPFLLKIRQKHSGGSPEIIYHIDIFGAARFKEYETCIGMVNEDRCGNQVSSFALRFWIGRGARVTCA